MNVLKRARLRAETFRERVETKRARFRADFDRLGRCPSRGRNTYKNGCPYVVKYGRWGRLTPQT